MDYIISEHKAKYDNWIKTILPLPLAIVLFTSFMLRKKEPEAILVLGGSFILLIFIFWLIMPRKFLIMSNKMKIILGASVSFNIPYNNIDLVRELGGKNFGINYSTSLKTAVEIVVKKGMNINFSPENRGQFIQDIDKAMEIWREYKRKYDQSYRLA